MVGEIVFMVEEDKRDVVLNWKGRRGGFVGFGVEVSKGLKKRVVVE